MAGVVLSLMRSLAHERFAIVGHDRGSHVTMRLAMDAPDAVRALQEVDALIAVGWDLATPLEPLS